MAVENGFQRFGDVGNGIDVVQFARRDDGREQRPVFGADFVADKRRFKAFKLEGHGVQGERQMGRSNSMEAVQLYLKDVVVPVLYEHDREGLDQRGTCTLLERGSNVYLLSAKHVFDGLEAQKLRIPTNPTGPNLITLWPFDIITSNDTDDIILLKLNFDVAARAREGWQIVTSEKCRGPKPGALFVISGFPTQLNRRKGGLLGGSLVSTYALLLKDIPQEAQEPVHPEHDLFFQYEETGTDHTGNERSFPKLYGVSGAAIWELDIPTPDALWVPAKALHLVGIETDAFHYKYVRGKHWRLIEGLLETVQD